MLVTTRRSARSAATSRRSERLDCPMRRWGSHLCGFLEGAARPFRPAIGGGIPKRQASPRPGRIRKDLARDRREDPTTPRATPRAQNNPRLLVLWGCTTFLTFAGFSLRADSARRGLPQGLRPANFGQSLLNRGCPCTLTRGGGPTRLG